MCELKNITAENINIIAPYLKNRKILYSDHSLGEKLMWASKYNSCFAIYDDTLIIREDFDIKTGYFHFPVGKNVNGALDFIENYCNKNGVELCYYCVNNVNIETLKQRYPLYSVTSYRSDSDYIYSAESLRTFSGKKNHGQKNHLNKFKKEHPSAYISEIIPADLPAVIDFLTEYENTDAFSESKKDEAERCIYLVKNMFNIGLRGVILKENSSVLGVAVGEINDDTLIMHIEKAHKDITGSYQFLVNGYALLFTNEVVKLINREDDVGNEGLRKSKLQYNPIELRDKIFFIPHSSFFALDKNITINTKRLNISDWEDKDKKFLFDIVTDENLNKFWGFDYKEYISDISVDGVFESVIKDIQDKKEYSLRISLNGTPIGELVFWNTDYHGGIEVGIRLKKDYQNRGYGREAFFAAAEYLEIKRGIKYVFARCAVENYASEKMILSCNFNYIKTEKGYKFFEFNL